MPSDSLSMVTLGIGVSLLAWAAACGAPVVAERKGQSISPASRFVAASLLGRANHLAEGLSLPAGISVDGVPFALVGTPEANNVFMKDVGWRDWQNDPAGFYAPYDYRPEDDQRRWIVRLPMADDSAVHLLAYAERDLAFSNVISFRVGSFGGGDKMGQVVYRDFSATVPRAGDDAPGRIGAGTGPHALFHVRVPLGQAIAQDLVGRQTLDVDVTKALRLAVRRPDPCRFRIRPLGLPCGVHVFAMTFERSPIQMEVTSKEVGHIFNEPQIPTFQVRLEASGRPSQPERCQVEAVATDYRGHETRTRTELSFAPRDVEKPEVIDLLLPVPHRGYHDLRVQIRMGKTVLLTRETSFALLPPDTRKYRHESPFGVRDRYGAHFTPRASEVRGPLYTKAGLRYAFKADPLREYGLVEGNDLCVKSAEAVEKLAQRVQGKPESTPPPRILIFHEDHLGGAHHRRPPTFFTQWAPYEMDEKEQTKLDRMMGAAAEAAKAIRKTFPLSEIYFGNGSPLLLEEFLRRKFPAELLGSRGCEPCSFARLPEAQPPDYLAVNASMWMDRAMLDGCGYPDTPIRMCQEICFPATNPGNLSLRTQAAYYVRHVMHMLAWRMPVVRPNWLTDAGNTYYFGNWGASGLCHAKPEVNPKPAYVACATMTLLLDGATFTRVLDTGSSVVYALEFTKKDSSSVTCLWTIRGRRSLRIDGLKAPQPVLTDIMANEAAVPVVAGSVKIEIGPTPVFLTTPVPLGPITCGPAQMAGRPEAKRFLISSLGTMREWTVEAGRSAELETYNYDEPRRKGDFEYAEVADFEGEREVLRVRPKLPVPGSRYLPRYSVLPHKTGVEMPGEPTEIGLMVNGNGGWGRVIFELEDASGQRWISLGGEQPGDAPPRWLMQHLGKQAVGMTSRNLADANANDLWGRSRINFEGWRYLALPLPGNYPGEGYHWPRSSQWRHDGDGKVRYPLRFKKLIITMPEKILYLTEYRAVRRQEIYLRDLMVTYRPPEVAFAAE